MKLFFKKMLNPFIGRRILQTPFELLHLVAAHGMNFGNGGDFRVNGELFTLQYVLSKLNLTKQPFIIFDVGANVGSYSVLVAECFSKTDFIIHSFEPSVKTFEKLAIKSASISQIKPQNIGLSNELKQITLYAEKETSSKASVYQRDLSHIGVPMNKTEEINITTIDLYCQTHSIECIHFLKLDVEGHELSVLKGAESIINKQKVEFIQFEFGGANIDSRTYFHDFWHLLNNDFNIYRIVKDGLVPISKYSERLEIFSNINYLAARKKLIVD